MYSYREQKGVRKGGQGRAWEAADRGESPRSIPGCWTAPATGERGGERGRAKSLGENEVPASSRPRTRWHRQLPEPSAQSALETPSATRTSLENSLAGPWSSLTCGPGPHRNTCGASRWRTGTSVATCAHPPESTRTETTSGPVTG